MTATFFITYICVVSAISVIVGIFICLVYLGPELKRQMEIDISVKEMEKAELKIAYLKKENGLPDDVGINMISSVLNVVDCGEDINLKDRAYILKPTNSSRIEVYHKTNIADSDKLFDFAHECGHLINGDKIPTTRPNGQNKEEMELLADYTGVAVLLPYTDIKRTLEKANYSNASIFKRSHTISEISNKYTVDKTVVARRIKEVLLLEASGFDGMLNVTRSD